MKMEYRRLGDSGLEVSPLCLGTMMFGDRTDAAESSRIVAAALDAGVNFIDTADAYAFGASETIVGAAIKARPAALDPRHQGRQSDDGEAARRRAVAALDHAGLRRQPRAPGHRLHRHLLPAQGRPRHADRRDGRRDRRPDPQRQDPLLRRLELPRLAHRRGGQRVRGAGRARAGRLPAVLQPAQPPARGRDPAGLRLLRPRRRALLADRARRADRQVRGRGPCPRTRASRAATSASWRPSIARNRSRSREKLAAHAQRHRPHAAASSRWRGCGRTAS